MISIYIPALNEEKHLKNTALKIIEAANSLGGIPLDLIIVNDGSTDGTGEVIKELESKYSFIRSIHHPRNQGLGQGLKEAIATAKYPRFSIISGDDPVSLDSIKLLFHHRDKADVIFLYMMNNEIRGRKRLILSRMFSLIYIIVFNIYVQYINGGCMYPTERLRTFHIQSKRFSYMAEMAVKCLRSGCSYYEIPYYETRGLEGSTSFSFKNFREVVTTFFKLYYEIYFSHKSLFDKTPIRVKDE
ncbi:MAG: glycosyltransferase family 2 protein [Candidatus Omnitrophota bacterium]